MAAEAKQLTNNNVWNSFTTSITKAFCFWYGKSIIKLAFHRIDDGRKGKTKKKKVVLFFFLKEEKFTPEFSIKKFGMTWWLVFLVELMNIWHKILRFSLIREEHILYRGRIRLVCQCNPILGSPYIIWVIRMLGKPYRCH